MSIKIGPVDFEITHVEKLYSDDDEKLIGQIDYVNSRISLQLDQDKQHELVTLWHEIVHGILHQSGYREHPEGYLDALAYGIVQVLKDNPRLRE